MPTLQTVLPPEIIAAVKREGDSRQPRASKSRVAAEAIIERYGGKRAKARKVAKTEDAK